MGNALASCTGNTTTSSTEHRSTYPDPYRRNREGLVSLDAGSSAREMHITKPKHVEMGIHIELDKTTGTLVGVPKEWKSAIPEGMRAKTINSKYIHPNLAPPKQYDSPSHLSLTPPSPSATSLISKPYNVQNVSSCKRSGSDLLITTKNSQKPSPGKTSPRPSSGEPYVNQRNQSLGRDLPNIPPMFVPQSNRASLLRQSKRRSRILSITPGSEKFIVNAMKKYGTSDESPSKLRQQRNAPQVDDFNHAKHTKHQSNLSFIPENDGAIHPFFQNAIQRLQKSMNEGGEKQKKSASININRNSKNDHSVSPSHPSNPSPPLTNTSLPSIATTLSDLEATPENIDEILSPYVEDQNPENIYTNISLYAEGNSGDVFLANDTIAGGQVAIKIIAKRDEKSSSKIKTLKNEINLYLASRHQNIVECIAAYVTDSSIWIVSEFMGGGCLADIIAISPLNETMISYLSEQILEGLSYLHKLDRIHRDIRSDNILLSTDGDVKITDFAYCHQLSSSQPTSSSLIGTPYWMSPQVISQTAYTTKTDLWSFGVLVMEMIDQDFPYADLPEMTAVKVISESGLPDLQNPTSDMLRWFWKRCTEAEEENRLSSAEALVHPFVQSWKSFASETTLKSELKTLIAASQQAID